jgi:hypothetical protein
MKYEVFIKSIFIFIAGSYFFVEFVAELLNPLPNLYSLPNLLKNVSRETIYSKIGIFLTKCFARNILYGIKLSKNVSRETFLPFLA